MTFSSSVAILVSLRQHAGSVRHGSEMSDNCNAMITDSLDAHSGLALTILEVRFFCTFCL